MPSSRLQYELDKRSHAKNSDYMQGYVAQKLEVSPDMIDVVRFDDAIELVEKLREAA